MAVGCLARVIINYPWEKVKREQKSSNADMAIDSKAVVLHWPPVDSAFEKKAEPFVDYPWAATFILTPSMVTASIQGLAVGAEVASSATREIACTKASAHHIVRTAADCAMVAMRTIANGQSCPRHFA